uniref:Predicted protein n=1 Tax=Hordeum vulgare subsp. vulgare TaxID=112509 RepID=F2DYR6_HORVV|nr:predicted protein [Hordeum vulgare subsp. vulgare]
MVHPPRRTQDRRSRAQRRRRKSSSQVCPPRVSVSIQGWF